jgi:electron transport complex protein RnfG
VRWTIRKDGGQFDQFTGASITPRAILKAVRRTLEYYAAHRERVLDAPSIHE